MNVMLFIAVALQVLSNPITTPISFDDALAKKQITATAVANKGSSHYQQPVVLEVKNITMTEITVNLPIGRYFQSNDTTKQNFVSNQAVFATLSSGETKKIPVSAMCVNHHKGAPQEGMAYSVKKTAPEKLKKAAQYVNDHKLEGSYLGQTLMWCISDNEPLESVFSYEESGVEEALKFLSGLTGKAIPAKPAEDDYERNPRARAKVEVSGNFEYRFSQAKAIHIAMFDENNIAVRELYNNPAERAGAHNVDYVFDASVFNHGKYYIRFLCDNRILMEQELDM